MNVGESHNDGSASSESSTHQGVTRPAAEAVVELCVETGVAGGHAVVEQPHLSDGHLAHSVDQTIAGGTLSAGAVAEEAQTGQGDVNTSSVVEELSAGALKIRDAGSLSVEDVVCSAVEASAVAGEVVVTADRERQALILTSVQIEPVLASHNISLDFTVTINSSEPSIVADPAETVGLVDEALVDSSETDSSSEDLELIAAIGVEACRGDCSIIEDNSGNNH